MKKLFIVNTYISYQDRYFFGFSFGEDRFNGEITKVSVEYESKFNTEINITDAEKLKDFLELAIAELKNETNL